jgi:hypothetical protein
MIAILGFFGGSLLSIDVASSPNPATRYFWFCFTAWQLMMLMTTSSIVSRRMRSDEWRRADWPVANR